MVMTAVRRANFEHGGAASSDLRQFLLLGHASDLKFYGAQRVLTAFQTSDPHMILKSFALSRLRSCMKDVNCTEGTRPHSQGAWGTSSPLGLSSRLAHCFQRHWRVERVNRRKPHQAPKHSFINDLAGFRNTTKSIDL